MWEYWRDTFSHPSVTDMFNFVIDDIDDERAEFTRSLAWRGPWPPVLVRMCISSLFGLRAVCKVF